MKRAVVLVVALGMIVTGFLMDGPVARAENSSGNHFVSGRVVAVEGCYSNATHVGSTCLGVVESKGGKHAGKIAGDVMLDKVVYRECDVRSNGEVNCTKEWQTSVGEVYLQGGELTQ
ncbi:membrane protein [Kosakonia phage Kc263]|uniref:Uncharacterized protein n=1 Tax=Kosakonia phage Kc263 TaxID=2863194 RepID=A0AAE7WFM6_9CAUD|nr:membrane protein [Kosakonia phage Kc263]QYN79917.1 hypothetical protein [Kosakonia phage Kc263]